MSQQQFGTGGPPSNPPQTPTRQIRNSSPASHQQMQVQNRQESPMPSNFLVPGGYHGQVAAGNVTQSFGPQDITYDLPYIPHQGNQLRLDEYLSDVVQHLPPNDADKAIRYAFSLMTKVQGLADSGMVAIHEFVQHSSSLKQLRDQNQRAYLNSFPNLEAKAKDYELKRKRHDGAIRSIVKTGWATTEFIREVLFPLIGSSTNLLENLRKHASQYSGPGQTQPVTPLQLLVGSSACMVRRLAGIDGKSNQRQPYLIWADIQKFLQELMGNTWGPPGIWTWSLASKFGGLVNPVERQAAINRAEAEWKQTLEQYNFALDQFYVYRGIGQLPKAVIEACQNNGEPQHGYQQPQISGTPSGPSRYMIDQFGRATTPGVVLSQTSNVFEAHSTVTSGRSPSVQREASLPPQALSQQTTPTPKPVGQGTTPTSTQLPIRQTTPTVAPTPTGQILEKPLSFKGLPSKLTQIQRYIVVEDHKLPQTQKECLAARAQNQHHGIFLDFSGVPKVVGEMVNAILAHARQQNSNGIPDARIMGQDIPLTSVVASIRNATGFHSPFSGDDSDYDFGIGSFDDFNSPSPNTKPASPVTPKPNPKPSADPKESTYAGTLRDRAQLDYGKMGSGTPTKPKTPKTPLDPAAQDKASKKQKQYAEHFTRSLEEVLSQLHTIRIGTQSPKARSKPNKPKSDKNPMSNPSELDDAVWGLTFSKVSHKMTQKYHQLPEKHVKTFQSGQYSANDICDSLWKLGRLIQNTDIQGALTYLEGAIDGASLLHRRFAPQTEAMGQIRQMSAEFRHRFGAVGFARIGNNYNYQGVQFHYDDFERLLVDEGHNGWLNDNTILAGLLHLTRTYPQQSTTIIPAPIWQATYQHGNPSYNLPAQLSNMPSVAVDPSTNHMFLIPVATPSHWSLIVIRRQGLLSSIQHLDSLFDMDRHKRNLDDASELVRRNPGIFGIFANYSVRVNEGAQSLQQRNGMDCGMFVLENARAILSGDGGRASQIPTLDSRAQWARWILNTASEQCSRGPPLTGTGTPNTPLDITRSTSAPDTSARSRITPGPAQALTEDDEKALQQDAQDGKPGDKRKKK